MLNLLRLVAVCLILAAASPASRGQLLPAVEAPQTRAAATQPRAEREARDRWYAVLLNGEHAGYLHTYSGEGEEGNLVTSDEMQMTVLRGEAPITIAISNRFVETPDRRPIEAVSDLTMGSTVTMRRRLKFLGDGRDLAELVTQQVNMETGELLNETTTEIRFEGDWMTAGELDEFTRERVAAGAESFEATAIDLAIGMKPVTTRFVREEREVVEAYGKSVEATRWRASVQNVPGLDTLIYLDETAEPVRTSTAMMGSEFEILLADRDTATTRVDPPELLAASLIAPAAGSVAIQRPRELRAAVYELRFTGGDDGGEGVEGVEGVKEGAEGSERVIHREVPRGGYQRVMWSDEHTAAVVVDLDAPVAPQDDLPTDADLTSSGLIDHEDPRVRDLLAQLAEPLEGGEPGGQAEALRQFVHRYIDAKNLSVGMATAGETAATAQGDCTEHAVLLTALLRARGIPARTVTGLLFVESFLDRRDVFGFHMWTRAWIDGQWVDLDPSLPDAAFDATHIALGVSDMADDGGVNPLVQLLPVMTGLQVRVVTADGEEAGGSGG